MAMFIESYWSFNYRLLTSKKIAFLFLLQGSKLQLFKEEFEAVVTKTIQGFLSDWMILKFSISSNQLSTITKMMEVKIRNKLNFMCICFKMYLYNNKNLIICKKIHNEIYQIKV
jgi:hypothetical protein